MLALVLIVAVVGGAYVVANSSKGGSATGSSRPTATATAAATKSGATSRPGTSSQAGSTAQAGVDLSGASAAFSNISSYKFSMTLAGSEFGSLLSVLGSASGTGNAPFQMSGTIIVKPKQAADIQMAGFHIVEVGGYDYLDMGTGTFYKTPASGSSLADSFSPETMFSTAVDPTSTAGWSKVGTETKNGVSADHYKASATALADYGSMFGVTGATWSADIWLSADGGYPVSMALIAIASDKSIAYEILFDLSNINDSKNTVTTPTNVTP